MKYSVSFDYDWTDPEFQEMLNLIEDDERLEELDHYETQELYFFKFLREQDDSVPLAVLQKVAGTVLEEAFEMGFDDILDRWFSCNQLRQDIYDEIGKEPAPK